MKFIKFSKKAGSKVIRLMISLTKREYPPLNIEK